MGLMMLTAASGGAAEEEEGNVIDAASASRADVASAIGSAVDGDTVRLPLSSSATWTSGVTIDKAITLDFNDCTITRNFLSGALISMQPPVGLSLLTRVTGGNFLGDSSADSNVTAYVAMDFVTNTRARLDHCTFACTDGSPVPVRVGHEGYFEGLIDNNTFNISTVPMEVIHNEGYGNGVTTGWSYEVDEGSADALYVEDNTFTSSVSPDAGANSAIQCYYGARTVFRYNDVENMKFDNHGTAGQVGGRWYEVYDNPWRRNINLANTMQLRAGSGVVYNNVLHNESGAGGSATLELSEDDPSGTYPLLYQIGRGQDQESDPLYLWNNTNVDDGGGTGGNSVTEGDGSQFITEDVDYFLEEKAGYSPYTYPHPLQSA